MQRLGTFNPTIVGNVAFSALRLGEWTWALAELDDALARDLEPADRHELLAWTTWLRSLTGAPTDRDLAEVEALSAEATDIYRVLGSVHARASIAFTEGRYSEAHDGWYRAAREFHDPSFLPFAGRAALWGRDVAAARQVLQDYEESGLHGQSADGDRTVMSAGVAALDGRTADALADYREALRTWRELGTAWDEALCGMDMAFLLDPTEPEVRAAAESAREILVRLGASPFIERLDAALARTPAPRTETPTEGKPAAVETATGSA